MKLREGNIFTHVCLFTGKGVFVLAAVSILVEEGVSVLAPDERVSALGVSVLGASVRGSLSRAVSMTFLLFSYKRLCTEAFGICYFRDMLQTLIDCPEHIKTSALGYKHSFSFFKKNGVHQSFLSGDC